METLELEENIYVSFVKEETCVAYGDGSGIKNGGEMVLCTAASRPLHDGSWGTRGEEHVLHILLRVALRECRPLQHGVFELDYMRVEIL